MAAQVCHACDRVAYPADGQHIQCDICGQRTVWESNVQPHGQWQELVGAALARLRPDEDGEQRLYRFRLERFVALGCPELEARLLAGAMYGDGRVDWHDYARLVEAGCAVTMAARILL